jgi:hypothetical protein
MFDELRLSAQRFEMFIPVKCIETVYHPDTYLATSVFLNKGSIYILVRCIGSTYHPTVGDELGAYVIVNECSLVRM